MSTVEDPLDRRRVVTDEAGGEPAGDGGLADSARADEQIRLIFLHFRPDFDIVALENCVPEGEEPKWPPISSHEYLLERLKEIKLA